MADTRFASWSWADVARARREIAKGWRTRALTAESELSRLRVELEAARPMMNPVRLRNMARTMERIADRAYGLSAEQVQEYRTLASDLHTLAAPTTTGPKGKSE